MIEVAVGLCLLSIVFGSYWQLQQQQHLKSQLALQNILLTIAVENYYEQSFAISDHSMRQHIFETWQHHLEQHMPGSRIEFIKQQNRCQMQISHMKHQWLFELPMVNHAC